VAIEINAELVTSVAGLVAAIGVAVQRIRDRRIDKREKRRARKELEQVARAAAKSSRPVAAVVDHLERTGSFQRPTTGPDAERDDETA
jgi:hypothetical protein